MTLRFNKPRNLVSTSVLWMSGFAFVGSLPYTAHGQQRNPESVKTFVYVANRFDNTVSVIDTTSNTVVATIPVGGDLQAWRSRRRAGA